MTHSLLMIAMVSTGVAAQTAPAVPAPPQAATIEGVLNYTRVDATIGCAGAVDDQAFARIAKHGYKAVLNLRQETEAGVNIEESRAASEAAGLKYIHLPFKGSAPDAKAADEFLKVVAEPGNQPLLIHCASGNRVAGLWLIKRMVVDSWTEERAVAEARTIGLTSEALRKFALEYVANRKP